MNIPKNSNMQFMDCQGAPLRDVSISGIKGKLATLLRNAKPFGVKDFEGLARRFGFPLMYGDNMLVRFDKVYHENELHYDGISSRDGRKVPEWLLFYVEMCPDPAEVGGEFLLLDCVKALDALPDGTKEFLRDHREEFYGYQLYDRTDIKPDELSFSIAPISEFGGKDRLRIHLPSERSATLSEDGRFVYSKAHNFSLAFSRTTGSQTLEIFNELRRNLMQPELVWEIPLRAGDVLVVNNHYVFHGRHAVSKPLTRLMHRAQMLAQPLE